MHIKQKLADITREMNDPRYASAKHSYVEKLAERTIIASAIEVSLGPFSRSHSSIAGSHQVMEGPRRVDHQLPPAEDGADQPDPAGAVGARLPGQRHRDHQDQVSPLR